MCLFESKYCYVQSCEEDIKDVTEAFLNAATNLVECFFDGKVTECDQNRRLGATTIHHTSVQSRQELLPAITWVGLASSLFGTIGGFDGDAKWYKKLGVLASFGLGAQENIMGPTWATFQAQFDRIYSKLENIEDMIKDGLNDIKGLLVDSELNNLFDQNDGYSLKLFTIFEEYRYYLSQPDDFEEDFKRACRQPADTMDTPKSVFRHYYSQGCSECKLFEFKGDQKSPKELCVFTLMMQDMAIWKRMILKIMMN